jgi:bacteriocin-like protein
MIPPTQQEITMSNFDELSIDELETVSGGSWISTAIEYAKTCGETARCMADANKDAW